MTESAICAIMRSTVERPSSARRDIGRWLGATALLGTMAASACAGKFLRHDDETSNARGGTSATDGTGARGGTSGTGFGAVDSGPPTGGTTSGVPECDGTWDDLQLRRLTSIDIDRSLDDVLGSGDAMRGTWPAHRLGARGVMTEAEARQIERLAERDRV